MQLPSTHIVSFEWHCSGLYGHLVGCVALPDITRSNKPLVEAACCRVLQGMRQLPTHLPSASTCWPRTQRQSRRSLTRSGPLQPQPAVSRQAVMLQLGLSGTWSRRCDLKMLRGLQCGMIMYNCQKMYCFTGAHSAQDCCMSNTVLSLASEEPL